MTTKCKCGKTYISKTTDFIINGSSHAIALNTADLLGYPKDILLESGQVFSTATNILSIQIGGGASNNVIFNSKLTIENQIKIVLKTQSGIVLGVKYIGVVGKQITVDNIRFDSSDLVPYLIQNERLIVQIFSLCDNSTSECCDKLPDFTINNILNTFCVPPTTTTTTTTTSTTLPPNFCFDNIIYDNYTTAAGTIVGTESGTIWTAGYGLDNIHFYFQIPEKTFAEFWQASKNLSSPFIINEILIINIPPVLSGQYKLIEKNVFNFGGIDVIKHKIICVTPTTSTTTTGTTTTGTTTTGTTTTGTTTTGTTTTCAPWPAPWPQLPCVQSSCLYVIGYIIDGLLLDGAEVQQYIAENPCYSGEQLGTVEEPCSFLDCLWISNYDGNNPPAWDFVNGACDTYNNNCVGNCGTCKYPNEFPPLENGIYTSTKCGCV